LCHAECPILNETQSTPCTLLHCKTWFAPVAVFTAVEIQHHIRTMESILTLPPPKDLYSLTDTQPIPEAMRHTMPYSQNMCKYPVGELTRDVFLDKWNRCEPFVLTGIRKSTSPADLLDLKNHGRKRCTSSHYDGKQWENNTTTLGAYFKAWEGEQSSEKALQIRVCFDVVSFLCSHQCRITHPTAIFKNYTPGSMRSSPNVSNKCLKNISRHMDR
jgi:hypothetical protein